MSITLAYQLNLYYWSIFMTVHVVIVKYAETSRVCKYFHKIYGRFLCRFISFGPTCNTARTHNFTSQEVTKPMLHVIWGLSADCYMQHMGKASMNCIISLLSCADFVLNGGLYMFFALQTEIKNEMNL